MFIACTVRFINIPLGEGQIAVIRPHPPESLSFLKPDPAVCHMTSQRFDQVVLVVHVVYGGQVGVLYSAEALGLVPGQGMVYEVVLLRYYIMGKTVLE